MNTNKLFSIMTCPAEELQILLGAVGAVGLVVKTFSQGLGRKYQSKDIELGIALLEGGNKQVQDIFYDSFQSSEGQHFFREVRDELISLVQDLRIKRKLQKQSLAKEKLDEEDADAEISRLTKLLRLLQLFCEGHNLQMQVSISLTEESIGSSINNETLRIFCGSKLQTMNRSILWLKLLDSLANFVDQLLLVISFGACFLACTR